MQLAATVLMHDRVLGPRVSVVVAVLLCLALASCAAGDERFTANAPAGFWYGLWHGMIALVAFVVGLFDSHVEIYERVNNGAWYDAGFLLGAAFMLGGGHHGHRRWRCSRDAWD